MSGIIVVDTSGGEHLAEAKPGVSIMRAIRDLGLEDFLALCGGNCACGTCHVLVDPALADRIPPLTEDEADVLDLTECRESRSRLSCQILFSEALDGLRVTIAADD